MKTDPDEFLEIVDPQGNPTGLARRSRLHGDPALLHRVVHVLVFNGKGDLLLQKRSRRKDVAPGKWDTSVGGHVNPGEDVLAASKREMKEELGIVDVELKFLYKHLFSNEVESELVYTFVCRYDGQFTPNKEEMDEAAFWNLDRIRLHLGKGIFSRHFEDEVRTFLEKGEK